MTQITLQPAKVNEFLQVEDVTLTEKSGGVLDDTNSIYKNDVDKFLQVEDVTLTKKSGVVLNDTNILYNQLRSMNFYRWKMWL